MPESGMSGFKMATTGRVGASMAKLAVRRIGTIALALIGLVGPLALGGCTGEGALPDASATVTSSSGGGDADLIVVSELPVPRASSSDQNGLVMVGDVIEVNVYGMDKLSRTVQVDSAGNVSLPLINAVHAANLSLPALERSIAAAYGRYLQSPSVTLALKDSPARRVTVDGQVGKPGNYPVNDRSTLSEAIADAGGVNNIGDQSKIFVYRMIDGKRYVANYNLASIRANTLAAPRIYGRDTVIVFSSSARVAWQNLKDALGVAGTSLSLMK